MAPAAPTWVLWLLQAVMVLGLLGLIVPVFPGLLVMWLGALAYGLIYDAFSTLGATLFAAITLLMIAGSLADNLLMGAGARHGGATWGTVALGILAGLIGTVLFPPFGGVLAAPLVVLLAEYLRQRDWKQAWQTLVGLVAGWGLAYFVRLAVGLVILALWWLWLWKG